jgi:hypothetical protein
MVEHFGDVLSGETLALPPQGAVGNVRALSALQAALRSGAREPVGP